MTSEYRKSSTWKRIGIFLAILVGLSMLPPLLYVIVDPFSEAPLPAEREFVDLRGSYRYRFFDETGDGRIDCVLRVPVIPLTRFGFYRDEPTKRCRGARTQPMPEGMSRLADELLALRREAALPAQVVRDLDGDGQVDCVEYDGTWRYVEDADCPEKPRSDAAILEENLRSSANRILAIERELNSRWLDSPP